MSSPTNQPVTNAPADSPGSQNPPVPVWLIVILFMLVYWGAVYFDENSGWFDRRVYTPYVSADELKTFQVSGGRSPYELGEEIYKRTCIACHGPVGAGTPGQYPPLKGSDWVNEKEPGRMIRIVLQGFSGTGLIVNGQPFNTGSAMVAWGAPPPAGLTDEEIAAVMTYVRGNKDWGNNAPPVTPEQVKAMRAKVANHPLSFTPDEIMKISPAE